VYRALEKTGWKEPEAWRRDRTEREKAPPEVNLCGLPEDYDDGPEPEREPGQEG